jgi:ribonucleoside-diphosphate reductase alpha chain
MEDYMDEEQKKKEEVESTEFSGGLCLECGESLYTESGCEVCKSCGYSSCG